MLTLAWRNVLRHRGRSATTLTAIVFGVAGLILTGGFVQDVFVQLGEALIHSQTGHLQVLPLGYYESGTRSPERYRIDAPQRLHSEITAIPGVADVMARVGFSGLLNNGRSDWSVIGEGVEPDKEARLGSYVRTVAGRPLGDRDHSGISIGQGVAQALKLAAGDRATLVVNTTDGALNSVEVEVVGVFQSFSRDFDDHAIRLSLASAQGLLQTRLVNSLVVSLRDTEDTERVAAELRASTRWERFDVKTWQELNDFYGKTVSLYERQFGVLQLIILAMVLLSVSNSVNMNVLERTSEFGTMRALGNRRANIALLVITESAVLGLMGGAVGVIVGVLLALLISAIGIPMPPPPNANLGYTALVRVVPHIVVAAFVIGFAATVLAGVLPSLKVARVSLAEALRANA